MQLVPFDRCDRIGLTVGVQRAGAAVEFRFEINGATDDIVMPSQSSKSRGERLWRATCFEAYVRVGKRSYLELDFSPSGEWAAYRFTDYRLGMLEVELSPPLLELKKSRFVASVQLPPEATSGSPLGLAAALEHNSGMRSYWALAHVRANRPDFHARDCFIAQLP